MKDGVKGEDEVARKLFATLAVSLVIWLISNIEDAFTFEYKIARELDDSRVLKGL